MASVQRFKKGNPCPICGGYDGQHRGQGKRCHGFVSSDGTYAHCSREEHAGAISVAKDSATFAHRLEGPCKCGVTHNERTNGYRAHSEIVARYVYPDEQGNPLHRTIRYKPKSFSQESYVKGKWTSGLGMTRRVLYRLPELLAWPADEPIFLVEGEADCDELAKLSLCGTTNPMGAGKWRPEYADLLAGKWIVTIADNDDVGREHVEKASASMWRKATKISRLTLEGLGEGGDLSDWLKNGGTRQKLLKLAVEAPTWEPPSKVTLINAIDLVAKVFPPRKWIVEGLISDGVALLVAAPKMGKSYLALNIAVAVASGGRALGGLNVEAGAVLYIALEGGEQLIQERLKQILAGGPAPKELLVATSWPRLDLGGLELLDEKIDTIPNLRLVIIDTYKRIRPDARAGVNMYDSDVDMLKPLQSLAEGRVAIIAVHHTNKRQATEDPLELVSGSTGLTGSVAATLILRRTRGKADAKLFVSGWSVEERDLACHFDKTLGTWTVEGEAGEVEISQTRQQIIEFLEVHGKARPRQIADAIGKSVNNVSVRLYQMVLAGQVYSLGDGLYTTRKQ